MLRSSMRKLKMSVKRFNKADEGSSAVEFAMVGFPFFYVLGAIFEVGLMMFTEYTLQASVQDAARLIKTGQAQNQNMSAADFKAQACKHANIIINCTSNATLYVNSNANFATLSSSSPAMTSIGPSSGASFNMGGTSGATSIVLTYDWSFALPFMKIFSNLEGGTQRRLVGFAMFRNEPF